MSINVEIWWVHIYWIPTFTKLFLNTVRQKSYGAANIFYIFNIL